MDELRDQSVLADMVAHVGGDRERMLAGLLSATETSTRYAGVWEHFSAIMPDEQLRPLAAEIVATLLLRDGCSASGEYPALIAVWRRCNRRLSRGPEHVEWLASLIRTVLPVSLDFADDLYYYWTSIQYGIVDQDGRRQVRARWVGDARLKYSSGRALCRALDPARPWSIRKLMRPDDTNEPASDLVDLDQWSWLAAPLLDGLTTDAQLLLPEVVNLVGDFRTDLRAGRNAGLARWDVYTLNRERIEGVFGQRANELLTILAGSSSEYWAVAEARRQASDIQMESTGKPSSCPSKSG